MVEALLHPFWLTQVIVVLQLDWLKCTILWHVVSAFGMFYFFYLCPLFLLVPLSLLILSDRFFICPVAEVAVVVVMGLQDLQNQNMCRRKKFLYSNYNEEQWVLKKRLAHNFPEKKKEKKKEYSVVYKLLPFKLSSCAPLRRR